MTDEQTLIAFARQSTKAEQKSRRKQQLATVHQWWEDELPELEAFARENIPDYYASDSDALETVRKNLRRCKATTIEGFRRWAFKQIAKQPNFHLVAGAVEKFDIQVSSYIDDGRLRSSRYADFPQYVKNGSVYLVRMPTGEGFEVWSVPEQWWEFVQNIWPVFLSKKLDGGFFIAKKISGVIVSVHRLVMNCGPLDTVQSRTHNFLDWSSLSVRSFNQSGIYAGRRTSWNDEANRPNTAQEEFEHRFWVGGKAKRALENISNDSTCTEFYSVHPIAKVNTVSPKAMCWGDIVKTGWVKSPTPDERDLQDATERYIPRDKPSPRMVAAGKALDALLGD